MPKNVNKGKYIIASALALVHQIVTYFMDKSVFATSPSDNLTDYVICKLCALIAVWFVYGAIYDIITDKNRSRLKIVRIIKAAAPYLIILLGISFIKLRGGYLSNDETLIYDNAISLTHYTGFYYITTYY